MEQGASTRWNNLFESEHELVSIMRSILARQKRERDVGHLLRGIHEGEYYLFDVDLSKEQAELLGWKRTEEIELLTEA